MSEVEVSFVVEKVGWRVAPAVCSEAGGGGKGRPVEKLPPRVE